MAGYYDPKKAHEYYEKHKKLKGNTRSTKGFDTGQKESWAMAKSELSEKHKANNKAITEQAKQKKEQLTQATKAKIDALKQRMKGMSKAEKEDILNNVQGIIDRLKGNLASSKEALTASTKQAKEQEKTAHNARLDAAYKEIKNKGKK